MRKKHAQKSRLPLRIVAGFTAAIAAVAIGLIPMSAQAAQPSLTSISPAIGTVYGGTTLTLTGTDFTGATGVTIGGVAGTSFTVDSATEITVTTPTRTGNNAAIGKAAVVVEHADGDSAESVYFTYSPDWDFDTVDTGSGLDKQVVLGDLASRTQGKAISRSATQPYTVTGTDSLTGEAYTYTYGKNSASDFAGSSAYEVEGEESTFSGGDNFSTSLNQSATYLSTSAVQLGNSGSSIDKSSRVAPYGTIFGPELYTEAFYASSTQSLAFDWAAQKVSDAYEVYAFLVSVADSSTIPTPSTANHSLVLHNQGNLKNWTTQALAVPANGLYRLRFVNGSYDETGGLAIGNSFYLTQALNSGLKNDISFGPFGDFVTTTAGDTTTVTASATSGEEVTVESLDTDICTVGGKSHDSGTGVTTWTVTRNGSATGECVLLASQDSIGTYNSASETQAAFTIRTSATTPNAPFISSIDEDNQELTVNFLAPTRDGGSTVTSYEYQTDSDGWRAVSGSSGSTRSFTIAVDSGNTALVNGTTYGVTVRAVNAEGGGTSSNSVDGTPDVLATPSIADYSESLTKDSFGTITAPTNSGGSIASWSVSPTLPSGLSLNTSTGAITGSPTSAQSATSYTITATNSSGSDTAILTLTISDNRAPDISYSPSTQTVNVGSAASISASNSGGVATSWSISGSLPAGLSFSTSTGVISGTPTEVTSATVLTVTATNGNGSSSATLTLDVADGAVSGTRYEGPIITTASPRTVLEETTAPMRLNGIDLDRMDQLQIDGLTVEFTRIDAEAVNITVPELSAGEYDVVTLSPYGTATHLTIFEVLPAPVEAEKKEPIRVVVTGFRGGVSTPSEFQINKLQRGIDAIDEEITGITCVGYTNGPTVLPNDPQVALRRASLICDYLKTVFPDLEQKLTYFNTTRESVHWRRAEAYFRID